MALTQSTRDVVNIGDISVALKNDATAGGITLYNAATYAPLVSPALSGAPTAPTQAGVAATGQIATSAFVANYINNGFTTAGNISLSNASPILSLIDTTSMSAFLVNNEGYFYILRNATTGATSWDSGPNGRHPMTMNLTNGDVTFSGNVGAYSDIRLKKNVETISNALDTVTSLRGVTYEMINGQAGFGFIAQEVETVFPRAVNTDREGYKSVSYANMTALLVEAVKTLKAELNDALTQIDELKVLAGLK